MAFSKYEPYLSTCSLQICCTGEEVLVKDFVTDGETKHVGKYINYDYSFIVTDRYGTGLGNKLHVKVSK